MKKILSFIMIFAFVFCLINPVFAANGYSFEIEYSGTIVKNVEKEGVVILKGVNAQAYSNVRIKIDVTGPAIPQIIAIDTAGNEHDIAQLGYWGPAAGFAVGGDFENKTPIKVTYPEEGTYTTTLSLIDVANANAVIETKTFTIQVYEDSTGGNTVGSVVNNVMENIATDNTIIDELPKTGVSIVEYVMYIMGLIIILSIIGICISVKNNK